MFNFTLREILLVTVIVALTTVIVHDRWPTGGPRVALEGYCPVTLIQSRTWKRGNPQFQATYGDVRYYFVGQQELSDFQAAPERYAPMCEGDDVVRLVDDNLASPGNRRHGLWYGRDIYLFDSEETLARFSANPTKYVTAARQQVVLKPVTP